VPSYVRAITPRGPAWESGSSWADTAKMKTDAFTAYQEAEAGVNHQYSPVATRAGKGQA